MNALNSAKEKIRVSFKTVTDPVRRRLGTAAFVGVLAGNHASNLLISG